MRKKIKGHTVIKLPKYNKFWVYDRSYGHDIIISTDYGKTTIQCMWNDRMRGDNGREKNKVAIDGKKG